MSATNPPPVAGCSVLVHVCIEIWHSITLRYASDMPREEGKIRRVTNEARHGCRNVSLSSFHSNPKYIREVPDL